MNKEKKNILYDQRNLIIVGKISSPFGVSGWLHLISFTEIKKKIFSYKPWIIQNHTYFEKIQLESWKIHNKKFIIKIVDINNRNECNILINKKILVNQTNLSYLRKGEYYWKDIINCNVYDEIDKHLGIVTHIIENKFYDILVIHNNEKKKEIYIPFIVSKIIIKVNINIKTIIVKNNFLY
ncbi:Ribosome maturation factor RimM [Buchnera aphidicola (Thelaxes suberi)]|uniref:ribosome maturation factor RimM n=1 Tax=Buchnera aphidicola TaxID=9 RepID=UPI003463A7C6